jgi:hypothetical protein
MPVLECFLAFYRLVDFYGMVAKAKASELNLTRTIWGFRTGSRREGKERIHGGGRDPAAGP